MQRLILLMIFSQRWQAKISIPLIFNLQFEDRGAVEFVETADDWEQEIGVLIDPEAFAEVWVGLVNEKDEMDDVFAKFLISHREEDREFHVIWKKQHSSHTYQFTN